jgi:hydroxymethylpyrimidine pyrophosphatase-like HAD family hydrolase
MPKPTIAALSGAVRAHEAQGIRFVVASGNQYYQLISFFPEIAHEIAFVAENGGWVVSAGEDVFNGELSKDHFKTVATVLNDVPGIEIIACGKRSAYTLKCYNDSLRRSPRSIITASKWWMISTT